MKPMLLPSSARRKYAFGELRKKSLTGYDGGTEPGQVIVADGTDDAARRLERVLWNDPATGVMRHADAGYDIAIDCAHEQGLDLPMVTS